MQIMVLSHSDKAGIDNNKLTIQEFKNKLSEEFKETLKENDTEKLASELLDVIQVCIGCLHLLVDKHGLNLKLAMQNHLKKLKHRGWKIKKMINFQVLDWRE